MSIGNHPVEQEELMAYLDGELSTKRAAETASHLEGCRECQQLAADLREVSQMLAAWEVEQAELEPPENVTEGMDRLAQAKPNRSGRDLKTSFTVSKRWLLAAGGLTAAAVVVIAFAVPNLLRGKMAANDSSPASLARTEATLRTLEAQPSATPGPGYGSRIGDLQGVGSLGKLQRDDKLGNGEQETSNVPTTNGPMIIRTADLQVTTDAFDKARAAVEEILQRHHGYVGELNVSTPTGSARSLTGTLRVPAGQLDATLSDLKGLGRTEKESQGGEEVTQQYVNMEARLANSKHTEQRLVDMLRERTGKLSDVLAVEMQISRVRGEIEQMEAQRKTMKNQVDYATVTVTMTEEYKAEIKAVPPSTGTQFRNAAVEGYRSLVDGIIAVLLWLLSVGPTLLLWAAILFFAARMVWRRLRLRFAK